MLEVYHFKECNALTPSMSMHPHHLKMEFYIWKWKGTTTNMHERRSEKEKSEMILTLAKLFGAILKLNVVFTC